MDNLIARLRVASFGCRLFSEFYGCLVYAEDILLLSHSLNALRLMLEVCEQFATDFDLKFNSTKSVAMHIGRRFNVEWTPLKLASVALKYVTNVKYIGVCLIAGTHLPARRSKRAVLATATWLAGWLVGCLSHAGIVSKQQNLS